MESRQPFGPGEAVLSRIIEVDGLTIACLRFEGFIDDDEWLLFPFDVQLIRRDGTAEYGLLDFERSFGCEAWEARFFSESASLTGGRLLLPFTGPRGYDRPSRHEAIERLAPYVGDVAVFEWGAAPPETPIEFSFQPVPPVDEGTASRYVGPENAIALEGSFEAPSGTWSATAFFYRGKICLDLSRSPAPPDPTVVISYIGHGTFPDCQSEAEWRMSGHIESSGNANVDPDAQGLIVRTVDASAVSAQTILTGGAIVPAGLFRVPDDFGVEIAFLVGVVEGAMLSGIEAIETLDANGDVVERVEPGIDYR